MYYQNVYHSFLHSVQNLVQMVTFHSYENKAKPGFMWLKIYVHMKEFMVLGAASR